MNVTLYFVLRMILRIVVLLCTNGAAMQFHDTKNGEIVREQPEVPLW